MLCLPGYLKPGYGQGADKLEGSENTNFGRLIIPHLSPSVTRPIRAELARCCATYPLPLLETISNGPIVLLWLVAMGAEKVCRLHRLHIPER